MQSSSITAPSAKDKAGSSKRPFLSSQPDLAGSVTAASEGSRATKFTSRSSLHGQHDRLRRPLGLHQTVSDPKEPTVTGILRPRFVKKGLESELYSVKFSADEDYIACGLGNGKVKLYSVRSNSLVHTLESALQTPVPVTSVSFRPDSSTFKTKSVLASTHADGKIRIWHYTSGKLISTIEEQGNEINDLSYRPDGLQFSTGGSDAVLRIYDSVTLNSIHTLSAGGDNQTQGHSSRVFCSKFHPTQKHLLVSGGWDNTLLIWDLRSGKAVRSIFGPHICGDSIDLNDAGTTLLTGSYSKKNPLQLWDWESGKLLSNVSWAGLDSDSAHTSLLYSASFSRGKESPVGPCNNRFMIAAGSNSNEIRVYTADAQRGVVGSVVGLPDAIYSVAMSPSDRYIAAGGGSQALLVFNVEERSTN